MEKAPDDRVRQLKEDFLATHERGMESLKSGDLEGLNAAIEHEGDLLSDQAKLLEEQARRTREIAGEAPAALPRDDAGKAD